MSGFPAGKQKTAVKWPGRRAKMVKWRTPIGKWASYAILGTYAFVAWNAIPVFLYYNSKNKYLARYKSGEETRRYEDLDQTEKYYQFFGWNLASVTKSKISFEDGSFKVETIEPKEKSRLLHELPPSLAAKAEFNRRQKVLEDLIAKVKVNKKTNIDASRCSLEQFYFPPNAVFEF